MPASRETQLTELPLFRFLVLELVCVLLMVLDYHTHIGRPIRQALSALTYPLVQTVRLPQELWHSGKLALSRQASLLKENTELKRQLSDVRRNLLQLDVLQQENQRLRQLMAMRQQLPLRTTAAFIININNGSRQHRAVIDRGLRDGVYVGQTVLDLHGLAGQVETTELASAHVILITDPRHALPVEVLRTGMRGIAYGSASPTELLLPEIAKSADVQTGDVLITSGFGGIFPRGLKVAEITQVTPSANSAFQQAKARPYANLDHLKEVLLVWPDSQPEAQPVSMPRQSREPAPAAATQNHRRPAP
jgi:rod shape-determining protein MreC